MLLYAVFDYELLIFYYGMTYDYRTAYLTHYINVKAAAIHFSITFRFRAWNSSKS